MSSLTKMRSSLHSALDRIGYRNSHACPPSKNNADSTMHELFVAHEMYSTGDKRRKAAIQAAIEVASQTAVDAVEPGTEQTILDGDLYSLVAKKNNPSQRIDRAKIGTELRKLGFSEDKTTTFMLAITVATKAALSIRAVPKL